jgi:putative DNA methylase
MQDYSRLIEHAFPLRQASIDSVHEKNVRHGHISTLHIWPARRPLAAARAALLATLLPDPGTPEARKELCEKIGGKLKEITEKGKLKEVTEGGVLHWKRETENQQDIDWFRDQIRKAHGGRAPKVLDPFAGGGAIPLEAMRLGCEVTAADINPVAWFILKCTLEYPQKLKGRKRPLPDFILNEREFMEDFLVNSTGLKKGSAKLQGALSELGHQSRIGEPIQGELTLGTASESAKVSIDADLPWHIRAWGGKVLADTRRELADLFPVYADWEALESGQAFEPQSIRLIEPSEDGIANADKLNADLTNEYLDNKRNPRWISKPVTAYLWARTVSCKNCRAVIPLLKTLWISKKDNNRVRLSVEPDEDQLGVEFRIEHNVPIRGGNAAKKRENDKKLGASTMSRAGAKCLCCNAIMTNGDIRYEGRNGRIGQLMTCVVVDGPKGKEYRVPTEHERQVAQLSDESIDEAFANVPFGQPIDPTPKCGPGASRAFSVDQYGFDEWRKLFSDRQLVALARFVVSIRGKVSELKALGYDGAWIESIIAGLACAFDRYCNYSSNICIWEPAAGEVKQTFLRFALPITWDFAEGNPLAPNNRLFLGALGNVATVWANIALGCSDAEFAQVINRDAIKSSSEKYDAIITDPPYYDAIPYSDLMDFFHIWLRRVLFGLVADIDFAFKDPLSPKWNHESEDGELIDDAARHKGNKKTSKEAYENGMARAFAACHASLTDEGRLVIVFAHKHPDAWETLVSAIIRAGFVVDGSWPIQTEMSGGVRNFGRAWLASSVWLVCRKRDVLAKVGWDNRVTSEMRENIVSQLREFWDAGIRGPDFVWAATGPAMEAYSKYPAVKKANSPDGEFLSVGEFLESVRRMVIEFVVGHVLQVEAEATDRLDSVTSYYLLHRNDFSFEKAPAGACILYAVSCGLSAAELERTWNLIKMKGSKGLSDDEDSDAEDSEDGGGSEFTLRTWKERKEKRMGYEAPGGRDVPLIDRVHRLMHLWREGDLRKLDDYIDDYALRRNELFLRVIQSLIELSERGGEERSLLESLSNHFGARSAAVPLSPKLKNFDSED